VQNRERNWIRIIGFTDEIRKIYLRNASYTRFALNQLKGYTGRFVMFSVVTNIYNKETKGPTLMELFTATGKMKKDFFWQLEMFDVCTTGDMTHIEHL